LIGMYATASAAAAGYSVTVSFPRTVNGCRVQVIVYRGASSWTYDSGAFDHDAQTFDTAAVTVGPFNATAGPVIVAAQNSYQGPDNIICSSSDYTDNGKVNDDGLQVFDRIPTVALSGETFTLDDAGTSQGGYHRLSYIVFSFEAA